MLSPLDQKNREIKSYNLRGSALPFDWAFVRNLLKFIREPLLIKRIGEGDSCVH